MIWIYCHFDFLLTGVDSELLGVYLCKSRRNVSKSGQFDLPINKKFFSNNLCIFVQTAISVIAKTCITQNYKKPC